MAIGRKEMKSDQPTSFGEVLQSLRKQKKMGQQPLADRLGVHRNTIGAWERGDRLPETRGMVLELAKVLRLDDEQTRMLLQASLTGLSSYWQVPFPRNPFFSGRSQLLIHLHQQLSGKQTVALSQSYGITGLGGIGKTQLALEYAYQHAHDYYAVFWISAETIDTISSSFTLIAEQLQLLEGEKQDQQQLVKAVQRWLSNHKDWLLIFDNVEDLAVLKAFLPVARQGAVLVTTRLHALAGLAHTLELSSFSYADALRFLLVRAHLVEWHQPLDELAPETLSVAQALVKATDGLPLALDQAGAYVEQTGCSLADYLRLFQYYPGRLLDARPEVADHPDSVVQTFLLSFKKVEQRNAAAGDLLRVCAFLHPDAIPEELLRKGIPHWSPVLSQAASDPLLLNQILASAMQFSLITRSASQQTLSLHRLVQAVLLESMNRDEHRDWLKRVIAVLESMFPEVGQASWWKQCERLLPHILLCIQRADAGLENLALASVVTKVGDALQRRGRYMEAEPLLQRSLRIYEQIPSADQLAVARTLTSLSNVYNDQGKYAQAEPLLQRVLQIREQLLGPDHPVFASALRSLGSLYGRQGKYSQAEAALERALTILEQALGPVHTDVMTTLANLAIGYAEQGKYEQAEPMFKRSLHILEQLLGPDHVDVTIALSNLGSIYILLGKYEQAEPLAERALATWEHVLGSEHAILGISLFIILAEIYAHQGKAVQAEATFERGLRLCESSIGIQHPQTAELLSNFAAFQEAQGKREEALSLSQQVLLIREQVLGPGHPKTGEAREHLRLMQAAALLSPDSERKSVQN
jgi:tetratricopeptide (TPR) repeat protein/DNA-binding XRE family transcriptional regulator